MMVRILSILPGFVGALCLIIVGISLIGYQSAESGSEVPIVPCSEGEIVCNIGMTGSDMEVPLAFMLLDIKLEVEWSEPNRGWIGVVESEAAETCPPDSNGLTQCEPEDINNFLITGGPDSDGSLEFQIDPGSYRFVSGGYDGAGLDSQLVKMSTSIHLNNYVELVLALASGLLLLGAGEMAFPLRNLVNRFREK